MTLQIAVPKTYNPATHIIVPKAHLFERVGMVHADSGHEVTHAELRAFLHDFLGAPLVKLIEHSLKHQDDPSHPYHQHALEAFHSRVHGTWHIDRYDAPIEWYAEQAAARQGIPMHQADFEADPLWQKKYPLLFAEALAKLQAQHTSDRSQMVEEAPENIFTTNGVNTIWTIIVNGVGAANTGSSAAAATAAYNSTQARIGVGDGTTAAAASDTDIQGTVSANKWWVIVSSSPSISTNQIQIAGSFGGTAANYAWQNFAADNCGGSNAVTGAASGTRSGGTMLDHLVSNQGTKTSGQTWNPTLTLSVS